MELSECKLIDLPKINDPRGNLTFLEGGRHIPFDIKRVFYLYDVPGGADRAGHALKKCHQFLIAMSGSFDVSIFTRLPCQIKGINRDAMPAETRTGIKRHETKRLRFGRIDHLPHVNSHGVVNHLEFIDERNVFSRSFVASAARHEETGTSVLMAFE